jgi:hypothetical protein
MGGTSAPPEGESAMASTRFLTASFLIGAAATAAALAAARTPTPRAAGMPLLRPIATRGRSIDSIRIAPRGADPFELRRSGEDWRVESDEGSLPADPTRIRRLLGELDALAVDGPIARDPSSHGLLGVAAEQAVHAVVHSGDEILLDLHVGTGGHARLADWPEIWKLRGNVLADLFAGRDGWEDRRILELPLGSIRRIAIERWGASAPDRQRLELVRGEGGWAVTDGRIGAELDQGLAEKLATQLEHLEALDVTSAAPTSRGLDHPLVQVRFVDGGGVVRLLRLGAPVEGVHHARLDSGPVWVAASTLVELLDRAPLDWRDLGLVHAEPEAIEEIRVGDAGMVRGDLGWACAAAGLGPGLGGKPIDRELAVSVVDVVRTLRGDRVAVAEAAAAFERAAGRKVLVATAQESIAIRIARGPVGWIARAGRAAPVTISDDAVAALFAAARSLESACPPGAEE